MKVESLDHLVLTVADIARACDFYRQVLGMEVITFAGTRKALRFGSQKINLHEYGKEFDPKAARPTLGSADLCFLTATPLVEVVANMQQEGIEIVDGPVTRTGATASLISIYIRDPDGNLIEIANKLS